MGSKRLMSQFGALGARLQRGLRGACLTNCLAGGQVCLTPMMTMSCPMKTRLRLAVTKVAMASTVSLRMRLLRWPRRALRRPCSSQLASDSRTRRSAAFGKR